MVMRRNFAAGLLVLLAVALVVAEEEVASSKDAPDEPKDVGTVIGIDLGTTYSCVGVYRNHRVEIIANEQGNRITPSYVAFTDDGERLVGDAAKNQVSLNPANTVFDVKRLIGRHYRDPSVQHDKKLLPFSIVDVDSKPMIEVTIQGKAKRFTPEEISSMILQKMRSIAEGYLKTKVNSAVVTVPAYFNDAQRQATKDAGTIAGLNVLRIINEPTAAAIAYGLEQKSRDKNILVYDLGGGTFDVSILTLDEGVFEVLATNGDTHLGGEDFDQRVMKFFLEMIEKKHGVNLSGNNRAVAKLRREVEKAKRALSSVHQVKVEIESFIDGADFSETLTRAKFEELNQDLFKKTMKPVSRVLKDAKLRKSDIAEIVLVGGSTRIPYIQAQLKEFFNGKEPHSEVNPDEAVAYGAAVQGGILSTSKEQEQKDVILLDVTPLSLGIELAGGVMAKIIQRNSVIPTKKSETFTTEADNQDTLLTSVYQGERARAKANVLLGEFELTNIPPAPRGVPEIEVTFELDANGILNVKAQDKKTGKAESLTIASNKGSLSETDISRMVEEAEKYEEEDKKFKDRLNAREELEGYIYQMKRRLSDEKGLGGKLSEEDRSTMSKAINGAIRFIEESDELPKSAFTSRRQQLQNLFNPIIERVYEEAGGEGGGFTGEDEEDTDEQPDAEAAPGEHEDL